jgi:uncharacterized protein YndB with AHSA1/START domain
MPKSRRTTSVHIDAKPEDVFAYVSDLTQHGDWAADPLKIDATGDGPPEVGSEYRSVAQFRGKDVHSTIRVTALDSDSRFSFVAKDDLGEHTHDFTFRSDNGGTLMVRDIVSDVAFGTWVIFKTIGWYMIGKPAMDKAYQQLKEKLE